MQTNLDQRARLLFGEKSDLSTFHHFANGNSYLYTLVYQSGLSVTFELSEKAIFVSKYSSDLTGASTQSPKQSQSEITSYLTKLKEIIDGYTVMFFAVLADGYLIQYQWQNTLYTYELNWDLEIRMKAIKDVILNNDATIANSFASETSELEVKDEIASYLAKGGSISSENGSEIKNITKIGKTNRYLIDIATALKQRDLLYQMVVRKGAVGVEIIGGSYKIDFTPSFQ
jgi:hypothetical protein